MMKQVPAFGFRIDRAIKALRQDLNQRFKANGIDLTPEQWLIMNKLYSHPNGLSQNEIADGSYKDAPTISRIIDRLVSKEQVQRQAFEGDRRRHQIILTDLGKRVVNKALPHVEDNRIIGWKGLGQTDLEHLERIMDKIYGNYLDK